MMKEKQIPNLCSRKASCCGCAACYSACPVDAITMVADKKGFPYPVIDGTICIGCRRCLDVCAFKKGLRGMKK